ncbi:MAG: AIPR family protein [Proteobacteria bacterium]|nr:AIPR family protein [Pseudomonadota bacterium]
MKELDSFLGCTDWLLSPQALEREGRPELVAAAREFCDVVNQEYSVFFYFVYCGPRDENIDKRIRVFNTNPENERKGRRAIHFDIELLEDSYEELRGKEKRIEKGVIKGNKKVIEVTGSFGKGLLTSLEGSQLADLYTSFGDKLFARNIRGWLGVRRGSVNAGISQTVEDKRERGNFWAYNNGITIVCDHYHHDPETGKIELTNFSIVNGCQTTITLYRSKRSNLTNNVFLLARIISPPESSIDRIIQFTNSQNLIRRWELVSQDRTQLRMQNQFSELSNPVYYVLRRGDWNSLSKAARRKYRASGTGPARLIKHDLLAQYIASFKGLAVVAYKNKAFLFDKYYEQTFPADLRVEEALFIWKAGECVQDLVRDEIKKEAESVQKGNKQREKYVLMLKRGGRFYCLAVLGLVAMLRNGPDYLRSINEERIVSQQAGKRLQKYAKLCIQFYKQAVDDLLQITGHDLSVLIRTSDFFERIADRVRNTYSTISVNQDWLNGALPKLF